jgi:hypothetical protein
MIVKSEGFCWRMLVCCVAWVATGCAAARITPVGNLGVIDQPVTTVALAPQGGLFADLVGFELAQRGCKIIDTGGTLVLLLLMHKNEAEMEEPEVMHALAQRDIHAVLTIDKVEGQDHLPDAVQARVQTTSPPAALGGFDWHNRWGRRSPVEAAHEIAAALVNQLCKSTDEAQRRSPSESSENPAPEGRGLR